MKFLRNLIIYTLVTIMSPVVLLTYLLIERQPTLGEYLEILRELYTNGLFGPIGRR